MVSPLLRSHPLENRTDVHVGTDWHVSSTPYVAMVLVRARPGEPAFAAAGEEIGVDLPTTANTWVPTPTGKVVWTGPDEWLVLDTAANPWELEERLRARLAPIGGAATDVSAQRLVLTLAGPHARDLLASGCSIDVHPSVFGRGSAVQTNLGQAGVLLLALGNSGDDFEVLVRSSFARYLGEWLTDASLEHRPQASQRA